LEGATLAAELAPVEEAGGLMNAAEGGWDGGSDQSPSNSSVPLASMGVEESASEIGVSDADSAGA